MRVSSEILSPIKGFSGARSCLDRYEGTSRR
jgi:hypothetical protein